MGGHSRELKPSVVSADEGSNERGRMVILGGGRNLRGARTTSPSFLLSRII
jgi:hypothetical protein